MHVSEGFISPQIYIPAYLVSLPLWLLAFRRFYEKFEENFPIILALTSFSFVAQSIMIPLPGSTSVHAIGIYVIACIYGPITAFICETIILIVQTFLLGKGGLTVLPVNAFSIGLIGPTASWLLFSVLKGLNSKVAVFLASWFGIVVSATVIGSFLILQYYLDSSYFSIPPKVLLPSLIIPHAVFVGTAEGIYSVVVFKLMSRLRERILWNS